MLKTEIRRRVEEHYRQGNVPLLLSKLGSDIRRDGHETEENGKGLLETAKELAPDIVVYQDPASRSYIVIYPIAHTAEMSVHFSARSAYRALSSLPRSLILAFCIETSPNERVFVRAKAPVRYTKAESVADPDFIAIDEKFRIPGLFVETIKGIPRDRAVSLAGNISSWMDDNGILIGDMQNAAAESVDAVVAVDDRGKEKKSALDRLVEAQPEAISGRFVIPADIALHLSKIR